MLQLKHPEKKKSIEIYRRDEDLDMARAECRMQYSVQQSWL